MKRFSLTLCSLLVISMSFGQNKIDSLVQVGIEYHDKGNYAKAIEAYSKALEIDPKSTLANYELSMTYMYSGDYKKAIEHSGFVIEQKKDFLLPAYIAKASSLSNLGKIKQAIKLYHEAIKKFGDNYLLYYNLGISYAKIRETKKAESAFIKAVKNNPDHANSHYVLALVEKEKNQRVQSLLSLYYFLLLEPSSEKSAAAYGLLREQFGKNVKKSKDNPNNINIFINPNKSDSEFSAAELMITMIEASNSLEKNKDKTPEELFIENTKSFFKVLGELEGKTPTKNIWGNMYIPFFYKLAKSEYVDVYCYYISQSVNENAKKWLEDNNAKFENFSKWKNDNNL